MSGPAAPGPEPLPRVLVVDDNGASRQVAEAYLQRVPVHATPADGGPAALDLLAAQPFDLILLDGMMPGMDGPATAREIRRRERAAELPRIPIVALSASVVPEDRRRMLEAGMDDHLAKPFRADDLARVLATWLPPTRRTIVIPPRGARQQAGAGEPAGTAEVVVDPEAYARLSDLGDARLVDRLVRLFLADAAERVAQVDEAIEEGDALRLRLALHALEGICGYVGAVALDRRARELHERMRREEDGDEAPRWPGSGPSGLEELLDRTRAWFRESAASGRHDQG